MQRTAIEWCDLVHNPVTGCYGPGGTAEHPRYCSYCYARRIAHRFADRFNGFKPTLHEDRLYDPCSRNKPARIFVCSMGDLFGSWVPHDWIGDVLEIATTCNRHTYIFLTKNPAGMVPFKFPPNAWVGVTCTDQEMYDDACRIMPSIQCDTKFVSFEPLFGKIALDALTWLPDWIIIGAQTGVGAPDPKIVWPWANEITEAALDRSIALFHKNNLRFRNPRREWPNDEQ